MFKASVDNSDAHSRINQTEVRLSAVWYVKSCVCCVKLPCVVNETSKKAHTSLPARCTAIMKPCCCTWQISQTERGRQDEPRLQKVTSNRCQIWESWLFQPNPFLFSQFARVWQPLSRNGFKMPFMPHQWQHIIGMSPFHNIMKNSVFHYTTSCN